jgi:hypothetical protein
MKILFPTLMFCLMSLSTFAQSGDTCVYVSNNNSIGGLDCAMGSLAPFTADTYQWLNCDSSSAVIPGQTSSFYNGPTSMNVALVISYLGCVDTSYCAYVCTWGLEELHANEVELVGVYDMLGRKTEDRPGTLLIYLYSDGTSGKSLQNNRLIENTLNNDGGLNNLQANLLSYSSASISLDVHEIFQL